MSIIPKPKDIEIPDGKVWEEMAKCVVLCGNCHAKHHWDERLK